MATAVRPAARAAVAHAAREGTASGLNEVLVAAGAFAAIVGLGLRARPGAATAGRFRRWLGARSVGPRPAAG